MAEEVLRRLVERGDRDRQRQTDQEQSIKATEYIGNGYVRQIGQAPTRSRYLSNAGLVPGELVAPLGHGQQDVIIHKKPAPFFTPETEEETIGLFNTFNLMIVTDGANQDYTVNIASGTDPNITIDWGDGVTETFITTGQKTHTYNSAGTYYAKLWGRFTNNGNLQFGSNASNRNRLKAVSEFPLIEGLISFVFSFKNCSGLTEIPDDLFRYNPSVNSFYDCFSDCTGLIGSIPSDLFRYNTLALSFNACFNNCYGLTGSIPADLFRYNILATDMKYCLSGCTGLTGSIPADLFRYNVLVTNMEYCLNACTGLTGSIPADLFRYNILATDMSYCLSACTGLTGNIPADLFRYNVLVTSFRGCLNNCSGLTGSIPNNLFRYNTLAIDFGVCLLNCSGLKFSSDIFSPSSEYSTRFAGKSVDFTYALQLIGSTGGIGVAPALWLYTFGSVTRTGCFAGVSVSTATNYADIPAAWK